jgi:hypothetical protein
MGEHPPAATFDSDSAQAAAMGQGALQEKAGKLPVTPHMVAAVVASSVVPYKRLQVELDNGQIWRETNADQAWDEVRYSPPKSVEIWQTRFGGYRMVIADNDIKLHVERVK